MHLLPEILRQQAIDGLCGEDVREPVLAGVAQVVELDQIQGDSFLEVALDVGGGGALGMNTLDLVDRERPSDHAGHLERVLVGEGEPVDPTRDDRRHTRGHAESCQRITVHSHLSRGARDLEHGRVTERTDQLLGEQRMALRSVIQQPCELFRDRGHVESIACQRDRFVQIEGLESQHGGLPAQADFGRVGRVGETASHADDQRIGTPVDDGFDQRPARRVVPVGVL